MCGLWVRHNCENWKGRGRLPSAAMHTTALRPPVVTEEVAKAERRRASRCAADSPSEDARGMLLALLRPASDATLAVEARLEVPSASRQEQGCTTAAAPRRPACAIDAAMSLCVSHPPSFLPSPTQCKPQPNSQNTISPPKKPLQQTNATPHQRSENWAPHKTQNEKNALQLDKILH
jgi:hypothetical protein